MTNWKELTAPCGMDCFNCPIFEANLTEEMKPVIAQRFGIPADKLACKGCRIEGGCRIHAECKTLDCVREKGVEFCHECADFPCRRLQPMVDGADRYPHNMKVYNLCRIANVGVDRWAEQESKVIRLRFYKGRFVIGSGPLLEGEE